MQIGFSIRATVLCSTPIYGLTHDRLKSEPSQLTPGFTEGGDAMRIRTTPQGTGQKVPFGGKLWSLPHQVLPPALSPQQTKVSAGEPGVISVVHVGTYIYTQTRCRRRKKTEITEV
jgi:hypothetical protein